jgi:N-acetyl-gamma-glutamyl-phosphate reductase
VVRRPEPEAIAAAADLAVLSLPNGLAAGLVPELLDRGVKVVDLSADYRYRSLDQWKEVYASEAASQRRDDGALCSEAVYGLVEWEASAIAKARLVAAPGCFPTASLLALLPFLKQGLVEPSGIVIDAKTGTSGGGRAAKENLLLAEASEAVAPYGVVGHRHTSEIEQLAVKVAGQPIQLQFTPHLMPMVRGLLATVYARLRDPGLTADDCTTLLKAAYRHSPSVEVLPVGTYPSTKWTRQTNRALLSVQVDLRTGQLIVMSAVDNLVKGQAGQGVQCLNLMAGLPAPDGPAAPAFLSLIAESLSGKGHGQRQDDDAPAHGSGRPGLLSCR